MISPKTGETLHKNAQESPLPVDVRRAKTALLMFPITLNNVIGRKARWSVEGHWDCVATRGRYFVARFMIVNVSTRSTIPYLQYLLLGRVHQLLFNSDMKVYEVNFISFFLSTIGWLGDKLSEKMLLNKRKRNVDENLTPRKTGPYSLQIMIRKVNIPLTASQFKQRATLLRLIRFSHKDNFVLSVCKRNVTKTNSCFLSHICWRAFASQHTILSNSGKKSKFVGCKIRSICSQLVFLLSGVFTPVQWNHVKRTWSRERDRTAFGLKANKGLLETNLP